MGFKLLIKQSFKNLTSKFRLYASLILFLVVGFSIINGLVTFVSSFKDDFTTSINDKKIFNFEIEKFKYTSFDSNDESTALFKFTKEGQTEFGKFLASEVKRLNPEIDEEQYEKTFSSKEFVNLTGEKRGYVNQFDISQNQFDKEVIKNISDISKYYSKNIMDMFLMEKVFKDENILTDYESHISAKDKDSSTTFDVSVLPNDYKSDYLNPYRKNDLNKLYYPDQKESKNKSGSEVYVSDNYLRNNKKKIGDNITLYFNNVAYDFYIKGIAYEANNLITVPQSAFAYIDLDDMEKVTNGEFLKSSYINGRVDIKNSKNPFYNKEEYRIASDTINNLLVKNAESTYTNNIKNNIFEKTEVNNKGAKLCEPIDYLISSMSGRYHQPLNIYGGFALIISISLSILIVVVSVFIIEESIRSEKEKLWFLKSMGESNFKLSLVNSFSVFVPLIFALSLAIPGMMLMMEFLITAILTNYTFSIHFYQLTWVSGAIIAIFLFGTMIMFMIINMILISGKSLNIQSIDKASKFQIKLAELTAPMLRKSNPKFRIGFAFVRQNLIKNIVSFFLFMILFTVTLFGIQFNKSIENQKSSYKDWFGDYNGISLLKPKDLFTGDNSPSYKTISSKEFESLRAQDRQKHINQKDSLEYKYNYDLVALINGEFLKGKDIAITGDILDNDIVINSSTKQFVKAPPKSLNVKFWEALLGWVAPTKTKEEIESDPGYGVNLDTIIKNHPKGNLNDTSPGGWKLRQLTDISLWTIDSTYISSLEEITSKTWTDEDAKTFEDGLKELLNEADEGLKQLWTVISQLTLTQKTMFGMEYPAFNVSLSKIIVPNDKDYITALGIKSKIRESDLFAYGVDVDNQPFVNKVDGLTNEIGHGIKDGVEYKTIDIKLSVLSRDRWLVKEGDIIPFDIQSAIPNINDNYAFKVKGFIQDDAVLLEGVYNRDSIYDLLRSSGKEYENIKDGDLDNVVYSKSQVPFFANNLYIPHGLGDGTYVDDYRFDVNSLESNQMTTDQITKVFVDTVKEYMKLMTKIIILLIILCVALSSIMITIILFENKKTILLFKAMGYRKRDIIWYLVSGYLIAVLVAFAVAIGLSFVFVSILKPTMASTIFLKLEFTPFWLYFAIGIFETVGFMALVIASVVTYARVLKPRDAFATL